MISRIGKIGEYDVCILDKETAHSHATAIKDLINHIPNATYTETDFLAGEKDGVVKHAKWKHSLIVFDSGVPIAVLLAYEREAEGNEQYPVNTIYINQLAVLKNYQRQGIGRKLLLHFISLHSSFYELSGNPTVSVQTNSRKSNQHVQNFYKSLGFKKRAEKEYPDRVDIVYGLESLD